MAFPDTTLSDPWAALSGNDVDATAMKTNTTDNFNALVPRLADSGWVTLTLGNSWVTNGAPYQAPAYRLHAGWVVLTGEMKSGSGAATVFTLPVGARPLFSQNFAVAAGSGGATLTVSSAGVLQVALYFGGGSNAAVALSGVQFIAEQ